MYRETSSRSPGGPSFARIVMKSRVSVVPRSRPISQSDAYTFYSASSFRHFVLLSIPPRVLSRQRKNSVQYTREYRTLSRSHAARISSGTIWLALALSLSLSLTFSFALPVVSPDFGTKFRHPTHAPRRRV